MIIIVFTFFSPTGGAGGGRLFEMQSRDYYLNVTPPQVPTNMCCCKSTSRVRVVEMKINERALTTVFEGGPKGCHLVELVGGNRI